MPRALRKGRAIFAAAGSAVCLNPRYSLAELNGVVGSVELAARKIVRAYGTSTLCRHERI